MDVEGTVAASEVMYELHPKFETLDVSRHLMSAYSKTLEVQSSQHPKSNRSLLNLQADCTKKVRKLQYQDSVRKSLRAVITCAASPNLSLDSDWGTSYNYIAVCSISVIELEFKFTRRTLDNIASVMLSKDVHHNLGSGSRFRSHLVVPKSVVDR